MPPARNPHIRPRPARTLDSPAFSALAIVAALAELFHPCFELIQRVEFPDCASCGTEAENLVDWRGLVVDRVWHYLADPQGIPNPAADYWLPGA